MAAFFDLLAALVVGILVWKGHVLRGLTMKMLLATEEGEKLNVGSESEGSVTESGEVEVVKVEGAWKAL